MHQPLDCLSNAGGQHAGAVVAVDFPPELIIGVNRAVIWVSVLAFSLSGQTVDVARHIVRRAGDRTVATPAAFNRGPST